MNDFLLLAVCFTGVAVLGMHWSNRRLHQLELRTREYIALRERLHAIGVLPPLQRRAADRGLPEFAGPHPLRRESDRQQLPRFAEQAHAVSA